MKLGQQYGGTWKELEMGSRVDIKIYCACRFSDIFKNETSVLT